MSEENQSPEQPSAEAAHPAPDAQAPAAETAEAPTVQAPVQGEIPPGAVPPSGEIPLGAVPPGAMPPGPVPPGAVPPPGGGYYYPPGMPMPSQPNGFGRFVRHRATQITAAAVLGLLIGGGAIALVDSASGGPGYGHHRVYPGSSGQGYGFQGGQGGHGGFGRQAPNGN